MEISSARVIAWWTLLRAVSVGNIIAWILIASSAWRGLAAAPPDERDMRRRQIILSALFVAGCAFRSFLPRAEAQRIVLYDSWLSSAMIGRSVATIAELSLVGQWALVLRDAARNAGSPFGVAVSRLLVPFIAIAELCSWYTTLTTNFLGSVIEESTWGFTSSLLVLGFVSILPRYRGLQRLFIAVIVAFNTVYVLFMYNVDVPMYWSRYINDQRNGRHYFTVIEGAVDSQTRRIVTHRFQDWRQEMPWMTLYFSAGVWISIALMRAPRFSPTPRPAPRAAVPG
jgi:hypothetical protein